ncbi:hypothetical protein NCH01_10870 [Neoasaia chiangmaiensis]|nr:hypothetical protein NCH01_10870 [Neoasaia chiangmaiensis]
MALSRSGMVSLIVGVLAVVAVVSSRIASDGGYGKRWRLDGGFPLHDLGADPGEKAA